MPGLVYSCTVKEARMTMYDWAVSKPMMATTNEFVSVMCCIPPAYPVKSKWALHSVSQSVTACELRRFRASSGAFSLT